jgi:3-hexulose-6-phosphate synthase
MFAKPLFQVALDYLEGSDVLRFAESVIKYVDIFDIGTLLLKKEGVRIVRQFKEAFPEKLIYADTKTLDLGELEARMVFDAGADLMSVCGSASDRTIELALKEGRHCGKQVVVDLIGMEVSYRQMKRLLYFQPDYVMVHTGVDEWHKENTLFQKVEIIAQMCPIPLVLSGGIQLDDIPYLMVFQPAIIVIGSAITVSPEPLKMVRAFWESINEPLSLPRRPFSRV